MKRGQQIGITLIEVVIFIIVLGIVAAVAAPKVADVSAKATQKTLVDSQDGFKSTFNVSLGSTVDQGVPAVAELDSH